jgi:hypothetical protein
MVRRYIREGSLFLDNAARPSVENSDRDGFRHRW